MKDSLSLSPRSKLEKASTIGQLDNVDGGYTSDSAGSSNDSLFFSETSRSTKRQRQMATRKKNSKTPETAEKGGRKRVTSASTMMPEKRQKTVEPVQPVERVDETAALPVRSMFVFDFFYSPLFTYFPWLDYIFIFSRHKVA